MRIRTLCTTLAAATAVLTLNGCALFQPRFEMPEYGAMGEGQLFPDMGPHTRNITTHSAEAQAYFNQGLVWMYSFNHDEAVRSFTKATEVDPGCAMAWWGIAQAQGPNYNDPVMTPARNKAAWAAYQEALARIEDTTPVERALIETHGQRYAADPPKDRAGLNRAYAEALGKVWAQYPQDSDVGTLYAESLMIQFPWLLYTPDREPARPATEEIVGVLEDVLAVNPNNPGANHLYIHAVEPSATPERAVPAADRLSTLVPDSGHLRHMPSHIYVQVGQWERSVEQNALAMESDRRYREEAPYPGMQNGYMLHNTHMRAFSAMMIGREREAMAAARAMWDDLPKPLLKMFGGFIDPWMCSVYDVQKRFGRWDDLLAEPKPSKYLPLTTAVWHAHRAVAYAAKKDFDNADREHMAFRSAMLRIPTKPMFEEFFGLNVKFLLVSEIFIRGEIALQKGEWEQAATLLEEAVVIEDALGYGEPPMWLQPVRHTLGAVYIKGERFADAERIYREDLAKWPDNGWSLYGLARALEEQGKTAEASTVMQSYKRVWAGADQQLTTTCQCIPKI